MKRVHEVIWTAIADVANWKRHQQLDEILIFFYPHYTGNQQSCL